MKPIDFVFYDGGSEPNTPIHMVAKALKKPIRIFSANKEYRVLSYYYHYGTMILDIEDIPDDKR